MPIWAILGAGLYLIACTLTGHASSQKGHGWERGFFVALFLSPLFGVLWVAALPDRGAPRAEVPTRRAPAKRAPAPSDAAALVAKAQCPSGCETFLHPGEWCPTCGQKAPG